MRGSPRTQARRDGPQSQAREILTKQSGHPYTQSAQLTAIFAVPMDCARLSARHNPNGNVLGFASLEAGALESTVLYPR